MSLYEDARLSKNGAQAWRFFPIVILASTIEGERGSRGKLWNAMVSCGGDDSVGEASFGGVDELFSKQTSVFYRLSRETSMPHFFLFHHIMSQQLSRRAYGPEIVTTLSA